MYNLSSKERRLIEIFLVEYKKLLQDSTDVKFNPRSLTIISQPNLKDSNRFDSITYNKWFDELDIEANFNTSRNFVEAFLDIPIQILISAAKVNKPLISEKDFKKLTKALKLLSKIKLEIQK